MSRGEYTLFPVDVVQQNPEEFIIEDCLDACKILWDKGIDTVQCSNYEDQNRRWIQIAAATLSRENRDFFYDKLNNHVQGYRLALNHDPEITVDCVGLKAAEKLCELANSFVLQDTSQYDTSEEYMASYKRRGSEEYDIDSDGRAHARINPALANATIEDALKANNDTDLYVPEEDRIYHNAHAMEVHMNYLLKSGLQPQTERKYKN